MQLSQPYFKLTIRLIAMAGLSLAIMAGGSALAQTAKKTAQPVQAQSTNRVGMTLVRLPAGSFVMGACPQDQRSAFLGESSCANPDPESSTSEVPQHRVQVPAFWMGKTEVTLGQFKAFIKAAGRADLVTNEFMQANARGDSAAVAGVSWFDAHDFIRWLNQVDGGGYRLPTEAEWEYACRAGGQHKYCGSDYLDTVGWHSGNSGGGVRTVASLQPNAWGLHDMSGNVWEWVQDVWHDNYAGAPTDGRAWESGGNQSWRVLRGGSWNLSASVSRAANRSDVSPGIRDNVSGFRVARTAP